MILFVYVKVVMEVFLVKSYVQIFAQVMEFVIQVGFVSATSFLPGMIARKLHAHKTAMVMELVIVKDFVNVKHHIKVQVVKIKVVVIDVLMGTVVMVVAFANKGIRELHAKRKYASEIVTVMERVRLDRVVRTVSAMKTTQENIVVQGL